MSRRSFVAGAFAAGAAVAVTPALAAEKSSVSADAASSVSKENTATQQGAEAAKAASATLGVDDSYVITLDKGLPRWGFEIAPEPIAEADIA